MASENVSSIKTWEQYLKHTGSFVTILFARIRGRPFNSWGWGWVISGHQEFFFLAIWWAGYFFPFFSLKLFITFVLHAIFFFRQALAGNFFSKSPTSPPSRVKWSAPNTNKIYMFIIFSTQMVFDTVFLFFYKTTCLDISYFAAK